MITKLIVNKIVLSVFQKINTDNIGFTYCGHVFCHSCIDQYNKKYCKKCPLCRTYLTNKKIFKLK